MHHRGDSYIVSTLFIQFLLHINTVPVNIVSKAHSGKVQIAMQVILSIYSKGVGYHGRFPRGGCSLPDLLLPKER